MVTSQIFCFLAACDKPNTPGIEVIDLIPAHLQLTGDEVQLLDAMPTLD